MFISLIIIFNSFMIRIDLLQFKWKRKNIRIIFKFRLWYSDYLSIQDGTWIWFLKSKRDFPLFISLIIIFNNSFMIRIDLLPLFKFHVQTLNDEPINKPICKYTPNHVQVSSWIFSVISNDQNATTIAPRLLHDF